MTDQRESSNMRATRGFPRRRGLLALALPIALTVLVACESLVDVENPNNVNAEDLNDPAAAAALVSGALAEVSQGYGFIIRDYATATDELDWIGSRDAFNELDVGNLTSVNNEFVDVTFQEVSEARWLADETIKRVEAFQADGVLDDPVLLARAYLYGGLAYLMIADAFDDFVFSDRRDAAPPIGQQNMGTLYDQAVERFTNGLAIANAEGEAALAATLLMARARAKHGKAVWALLNPPGRPANPLAAAADAAADAQAAITAAPTADFKFRFNYSGATVSNIIGAWVNERLEMRISDTYARHDAGTGTKVEAITFLDPIDLIPDPRLEDIVFEFVGTTQFGSLTMLSVREMHLIIAENALASSNLGTFTTAINNVRALDALTPWAGQTSAQAILQHERRVNLFLGVRRLSDMYRFGELATRWQPTSDASARPGTFFPITITEIRANPNCGAGSC